MIEKNGIRIDALTIGDAEDARIEFLVRANGSMATFTLGDVLKASLDISKDYGDDRMDFIRCLVNEGHRLGELK